MDLLAVIGVCKVILIAILVGSCPVTNEDQELKFHSSFLIPKTDQNYTEIVSVQLVHSVRMCSAECLQRISSCLLVVYVKKNQNCTVIIATSNGGDDKAGNNYLNGDIFVSTNYDKIMKSVKPPISPSSCLPEVPLPSSTYKLLQQRVDGCLLFNKNWNEYSAGFGHPTGNYWAGLELMHSLTWTSSKGIRFEMKKFNDDTLYVAIYSSLKVGSASDFHRLYISGYNAGQSNFNAETGGGMLYCNNKQFSTMDQDHDGHAESCSLMYQGRAWWFGSCIHVFGNGIWMDHRASGWKYIVWNALDGSHSLSYFRMLLIN